MKYPEDFDSLAPKDRWALLVKDFDGPSKADFLRWSRSERRALSYFKAALDEARLASMAVTPSAVFHRVQWHVMTHEHRELEWKPATAELMARHVIANHSYLRGFVILTPAKQMTCSQCGAKTVKYKHSLSHGLVSGLRKVAENAGRREVNLSGAGLTRNQWDNFQKLKYWGLVAQSKAKSGCWRVTDKGWKFLAGLVTVPSKVWTYRGVFDRFGGSNVSVTDLQTDVLYEKRADFSRNSSAIT